MMIVSLASADRPGSFFRVLCALIELGGPASARGKPFRVAISDIESLTGVSRKSCELAVLQLAEEGAIALHGMGAARQFSLSLPNVARRLGFDLGDLVLALTDYQE